MNKSIVLLLVSTIFSHLGFSQTVLQARNAPLLSSVTFKGIVINGTELGANIRYIQDTTAGIAIYGANASSLQRGDSVLVTGTLTNYNNLAEVKPVASFTVLNSNNSYTPLLITPSQISDTVEGRLVRFDNCIFANAGASFAGNTNYNVTCAGTTFQVRVGNAATTIVGTTIPSAPVTIVGVMSQYCTSAPPCATGYQLLMRDLNDIIINSSIFVSVQPLQSNITTTSFDVNWSTNVIDSISYVKYGLTENLELGSITANDSSLNHLAQVNGLMPGTIYYVKTFSLLVADTASSLTKVYATKSLSSGTIKCYFNRDVDTTVATIEKAHWLNYSIADTLKAYIDRAKKTLCMTIYNWDNSQSYGAKIIAAVNAAQARGVKVRIIFDGASNNSAYQALSGLVPVAASPTGTDYNIMHNKFIVIDANDTDPNVPIVWTGSTNWTNDQLNKDANSVIIFQDQSMARSYMLEFNEIWGDTVEGGATNMTNAKYGQYKKDNTAHEFVLGANNTRIESYFSPSDNTNSKIISTIATANASLNFSEMLITRADVANKIASQITSENIAADSYGLMDDTSGVAAQNIFNTIHNVMGGNFQLDGHGWILHHKYFIIDQNNSASDPLVWVGSHNVTNSADTKNDENSVVVHDANITNQYWQEFHQRWIERNTIDASVKEWTAQSNSLELFPNPNNGIFTLKFASHKTNMLKMQIYDMTGNSVLQKHFNVFKGINSLLIDATQLPKGIYQITITTSETTEAKKLVIK